MVALRPARQTIVAGIIIALLAAMAAVGINAATGHSNILRATGHMDYGVLAGHPMDEMDYGILAGSSSASSRMDHRDY
jgi:hypothetical protein